MQTRVVHVDPKTLKLLEVNARFMRHEEFQRLVANVKQDGQLTSAPFAARNPDGTYEVLSGNHRVQAAIAAGLETIPCIITDDELSKEQRIAIQLSHNAIVGQDDPDTLKKLYDEIFDIDLKEYSGLDDKTLGLLDKAASQAMTEANLEYQVLSVVYLPDELKDAQRIIDKAKDAGKNSAAVWLAKDSEYDRWLDAQETVSSRRDGTARIPSTTTPPGSRCLLSSDALRSLPGALRPSRRHWTKWSAPARSHRRICTKVW